MSDSPTGNVARSDLRPVRRPGAARRFFGGMGYLGRGLRMWGTSPRLMLLGTIPALIVGTVYTAAIIVFSLNLDAIAEWVTPFADGWTDVARAAMRLTAGVALIGGALLLAVLTFAGATLAVGDPFYEKIWSVVEDRLGGAPVTSDEPFWRVAARNTGTALRLFAATAALSIVLFACGFIPLVGQMLVPVLGATFGGWFLTLELSGFAFDARRFPLKSRRRMLGSRRASTLGFGVLTYLLFLIPFGAVVVMPAAVAGATMLSRDAMAAKGVVEPARP